jgi:RNA polymerase sigma-70 factor, ECF subfamily
MTSPAALRSTASNPIDDGWLVRIESSSSATVAFRRYAGPGGTSRNPPHKAAPAVEGTGPPQFEAFYATHFQRLALQLYAYTNDLAQAHDFVQEAFSRALPRWDQVSRYDDPLAWLRRVAWNLATSRFRRLRVARTYLQGYRELHVEGPTPDRVALTSALAKLSDQQRRAVVLFHLVDLTIAQIARQEGVSENTVKTWLHRGRAALAIHLDEFSNGVAQ